MNVDNGSIFTTRCQPAVLQLLPFSSNHADSNTSRNPINRHETSKNKNFPVLAVTRTNTETSRSQSAYVKPLESSQAYNLVAYHAAAQRKKLIRTHSERILRGNKNRPEAKDLKLYASVEGSEQKHGLDNSNTKTAGHLESSPSRQSVSRQGKVPTTLPTTTFYTSEEPQLAIEDEVLQSASVPVKPLHSMEPQTSTRSEGTYRRLKLNVKELPRSKTPIPDNDPDKLNINHVIAFLDIQDHEESSRTDKKHDSVASPAKYFSIKRTREITFDQLKGSYSGGVPDTPTFTKSQPAKTPLRNTKSKTTHSLPDPNNQRKWPPEGNRSHSHHSLAKYSDYTTYNINSDPLKRPASLQWRSTPRFEQSENRIKKPFRLHRFLTLVPTVSNEVHDNPSSITHSQNNNTDRVEFTAGLTKLSSHTEIIVPDTKRVNAPEPSQDILPITVHKFLQKGSLNVMNTQDAQQSRSKTAVICLPTAYLDADSDDESTTFPAANKRSNTLTAQVAENGVKDKGTTSNLAGKIHRPQSFNIHNTIVNNKPPIARPASENIANNKPVIVRPASENLKYETNSSKTNTFKQIDDKAASKTRFPSLTNFLLEDTNSPIRNPVFEGTTSLITSLQVLDSPEFSPKHRHEASDYFFTRADTHSQNYYLTPRDSQNPNQVFKTSSPKSPKNEIKLSLRKERTRTSADTYMTDLESSPFKKTS